MDDKEKNSWQRCVKRKKHEKGSSVNAHNLAGFSKGLSISPKQIQLKVSSEDFNTGRPYRRPCGDTLRWKADFKEDRSPRYGYRYGLQERERDVERERERELEREMERQREREMERLELKELIRSQKVALDALHAELENERSASAIAAEEAMAMISRLQEEKSGAQMEARHYKRMAEERAAHNEETIALLKELLMKREEDVLVLEEELEARRQMFFKYEANGCERDKYSEVLLKGESSTTGRRSEDSMGAKNSAIWERIRRLEERLQCLGGTEASHNPTPSEVKYENQVLDSETPEDYPYNCSEDSSEKVHDVFEVEPIPDQIKPLVRLPNEIEEFPGNCVQERFEDEGRGIFLDRKTRNCVQERCKDDGKCIVLDRKTRNCVHERYEEDGKCIVLDRKTRNCVQERCEDDGTGIVLDRKTRNCAQERCEHDGRDMVLDRKTLDSSHEVRSSRLETCDRSDMEIADTHDEIGELMKRLQALESERVFMMQAVESLKRENAELRLLHEISQQLKDLKSDTTNSNHTSKGSLQRKESRLSSVFRGILSFVGLINSDRARNRRVAHLSEKFSQLYSYPKNRVGLMHLLKEPSPSMSTCVTRDLKVTLPLDTKT